MIRIYRQTCRQCGDPFDSLDLRFARCMPCREGIELPEEEKLVSIIEHVRPPLSRRDRSHRAVYGKRASDVLRYDERLRPNDPAGKALLEDAIDTFGSKNQVEQVVGLGSNTLRNYLSGRVGIPFGVVDALLSKLGRSEALSDFHFHPNCSPALKHAK